MHCENLTASEVEAVVRECFVLWALPPHAATSRLVAATAITTTARSKFIAQF
jgi:hypothetical protein